MKTFSKNISRESVAKFSQSGSLAILLISLLTLAATFIISNSNLSYQLRTIIFALNVAFYLLICGGFYFLQKRHIKLREMQTDSLSSDEEFTSEILEKLLFLEEANAFFGHSLKIADMFRLVSNRINEMIPFNNCVLYLADEKKTKLKAVQCDGENAGNFLDFEFVCDKGLAGKAFLEQKSQFDKDNLLDKEIFLPEIIEYVKMAVAVPLWNKNEVFGVIALYSFSENGFDKQSLALLDEIGSRISRLFFNSLTFELNLENSLTDAVTKLPNERAFYLILENQIAESRRVGEMQRPLTVLNMDIQNFDEINRTYGFAAGDRILALTAKIIKGQLRQMDFLARSKNDEFLAILPTANEEITRVIIERIEKVLDLNSFELREDCKFKLNLNFGSATFIKNEDTAQELLKRAEMKKENLKYPVKNSVVMFPGEFVN